MSPEQARGKPVDKRTDLWAFGCVLYEMLTGRPAFAGDASSDTIARILERDPDWRALPAATPPSVTRLLQRCLSKDPKRRLHDIADARIEIEDALSGASLTPAETAGVDRQRVRLPWTIAVVTSVVALIAVVALTWYVRTARQSQTRAAHLAHDNRIVGHGGGHSQRRSQPGDHVRRHACRLRRQQRQTALRPPARSARRGGDRHRHSPSELGLRLARQPVGRVR